MMRKLLILGTENLESIEERGQGSSTCQCRVEIICGKGKLNLMGDNRNDEVDRKFEKNDLGKDKPTYTITKCDGDERMLHDFVSSDGNSTPVCATGVISIDKEKSVEFKDAV